MNLLRSERWQGAPWVGAIFQSEDRDAVMRDVNSPARLTSYRHAFDQVDHNTTYGAAA
jgi:hypothetical protein